MEYLRTSDERFEQLDDFPFKPHYLQNGNLRMAYVDEVIGGGLDVFLCLHGEPTWSYLYRKMIPVFLNYSTSDSAGGKPPLSRRVVAPDFFGFGRSDKPRHEATYDFDFHRNAILHLIKSLDLTNITLVVQDWGGVIGLTLPVADPSRFKRLLVMNTAIGPSTGGKSPQIDDWIAYTSSTPDLGADDLMAKLGHPHLTEQEQRAYRAPFPDNAYTAGMRRFPQMIMVEEDMPGVQISRESRNYFESTDRFRSEDVLVVCGMKDPILGPRMKALASIFKNGCYYTELKDASHFVQEWGDQVAKLALRLFENKNGSVDGVSKIEPGVAQ